MSLHEEGVIAIDKYLKEYPDEKGKIKSRKEIYAIMNKYNKNIEYEVNNVAPTDLCWNRVNNKPGTKIFEDFEHWPHALEYVNKKFKLLGSDILYTGEVYHAGYKCPYGYWNDGVLTKYTIDICTDIT